MTDNEKMREDFETWAVDQGMCITPYGASYADEKTHTAWITWQAAKSVPDEEAITCDTCGAVTDNPWHSSRGTNRHYHECDKCREQAVQLVAGEPLECCGCHVEGNEYMGQVQMVCCGQPEPAGVAKSVPVVGEPVVLGWYLLSEYDGDERISRMIMLGQPEPDVFKRAAAMEGEIRIVYEANPPSITDSELERLRGLAKSGAMLGHENAYEACLKIDAALTKIIAAIAGEKK